MKRWQTVGLKCLGGIGGFVVGILVIVEIILSPAVATRLVNKYAPQFLDADLSFGKAGVSVLLHFPNLSVKINDAVLTYPHDRYADYEDSTALMMEGRAEAADTLARFDRFTASVSVPALITKTVRINRIELEHPRIFAKKYDSETANWDIFGPGKEDEDTTSSSSFSIKLKKLKLNQNAHIVFCMPQDSLYATLDLREMTMKGKIATDDLLSSRGHFNVDALAVAADYKENIVEFDLNSLGLSGNRKHFGLDADAVLYAALRGCGKVTVPVSLEAKAGIPKDTVLVVKAKKLAAEVAGIPLDAKGEAILYSDRCFVDAEASMIPVRVGELVEEYGPAFWTEAGKIESDACIHFDAQAKGYYVPETGEVPRIHADLVIPDSYLRYKGVEQALHLRMDANADGGAGEPVDFRLDTLSISTDGLELGAGAVVKDLLGADPDIRLNASLAADIARALGIVPADMGIRASGSLDAALNADALLSQLNMNRIGNADITGRLSCRDVDFAMPADTLSALVDGVSVTLGSSSNKYDESMSPDARVLMLSASIDTLNAGYKGMFARAGRIFVGAQNSADILDDMELSLSNVRPFSGFLSIGSAGLKDCDSSMVAIRDSRDLFTIRPKNGNRNIPVLHLRSNNGGVALRSGANRLFAKDLGLDINAVMNTFEKKARISALRDSLSRLYPDVPKDSVLRYAFRKKMEGGKKKDVPEWLQEEDFKKGDLNFALTGALAKYFNEWNLDGNLSIAKAGFATPYFPLRTSLSNAKVRVTNDLLNIRSLLVRSGESNVSLSGGVTNLKHVLRGRGVLGLELRVKSDRINANELLAALDAGQKVSAREIEASAAMDDEEYEKSVTRTDLPDTVKVSSLIVIPANINAELFIDANNVEYSSVNFDWLQAEATMKERCLQLTNLIAMSNMGNVYCEAFYSTKTKKNIKAGVTVDLEDITAERMIELLPSVDSLVPMLRSFSGLLNCSLAVTTALDEEMNILFPTVNGVVRISGSDLLIDDMGDLAKITKLLMFKNKNQVFVDHMEVNGLVEDNKLEIFPFVLDVDRYKLALSGTQNLDKSFKYHVSVMKWPLLFKFGIDLSGNFDKFKFHIGKAKYRREKKVPLFTEVVDESKANLKDIIHNVFRQSVDKAVEQFNSQQAIKAYKDSLSYVPAENMPLDTLGGKNMELLEKADAVSQIVNLETADLNQLDSLQTARLDSLGISVADLKKLKRQMESDEE